MRRLAGRLSCTPLPRLRRALHRLSTPRSRLRGTPDRAGVSSGKGDAGYYPRALVGCADQLDRPADPSSPLPHGAQPEVSGEAPLRIETDSVVRDLQHEPAVLRLQLDLHLLCSRVLDGVVERLLRDSVEHLLDFQGLLRLLAVDCLDLKPVPCPERFDLLVQGHHEALRLKRFRPQFEYQSAHLRLA